MAKKVMKKEPHQPIPDLAIPKDESYPDLRVGGRFRVWGYTKPNMPGYAWLFHQKLTPSELRAVGEWCIACSGHLVEKSK